MALYFYTTAQGTETWQQTRVCLLHKCLERLRRMIKMQMMMHRTFSRPILGQYGRHMPKEIFTRLTRGDSVECTNRAIIHAGIVFRCTGQMMTLYSSAIFFEMPYANLQHAATHICLNAAEYPQAKLHDCVRCYFTFRKQCWSSRLDINVTRRIESLMFEIIGRWETTLEGIERAAQSLNRMAKYVMATAHLNKRAIFQRYASHMQDLADRVAEERIRPASIETTIRRTFGFEEGPLWDSPGNI